MRSPLIRVAVDEFMERYEPPERSKTTCRLMRQTTRELLLDDRLRRTADLSPATISRWMRRHPERTEITRAVHLRNLRTLCNYCVGRGWLHASPFTFDQVLRRALRATKDARRRHHSLAEIGCVLGFLRDRIELSWEDHRLWALASLVAHTGVRAMEALHAEIDDIDLVEEFFRVEPKEGHPLKTKGSERYVPIPPQLLAVLREWLPLSRTQWAFPGVKRYGPWVGGLNGHRPLDRLRQAGEAVGVEGFTFLSLRHSFMTHGRGPWKLGSKQIQQMAGHSLEDTQEHYLGFDRENLRVAASTIAFPIPPALARA